MCGIYLTNFETNKYEISSKLDSINYRGPDNQGIVKINNIYLAHLRLSIIDLDSRSNQPMSYENLYITFNGEIYNYEPLKEELIGLGYSFETTSDTEVLLKGYHRWGNKLLSKINGMFAFAIYDSEKHQIFVARDRLGVKPLYYYWNDNKLEICSQIRPLINSESQINEEAISIYLDCGYIPSPYSAIKNILKLPPGQFLAINLKTYELKIDTYWKLKKVAKKKISYENAKSKLHDLLMDAVKIRLQSDVPIGSFLSGGIDSALVSALATKASKAKINTFSIGFKNQEYDESGTAKKYADILGTNHTNINCRISDVISLIPKYIDVFDEPFADSSGLPSLLLNSVTKKHVTVALSGDGGDESFLGYNYFAFLRKNRFIFYAPLFLRLFFTKIKGLKILRRLTNKFIPEKLFLTENVNTYILNHFIGYDSFQKKRDLTWAKFYREYQSLSNHYLQRAADLNIKLWLENDSNVKVDRASMAYSVEVRSPFLDYRVIEFARTLPIKFRFHKKIRKRILKDILEDYIPKEVFDQPKKGFSVPLGEWMRNELKKEILTSLDDNFLNSVPHLDVKKFKQRLEKHMNAEANYKTNIWKLYVLRKWYEEFGFYKAS